MKPAVRGGGASKAQRRRRPGDVDEFICWPSESRGEESQEEIARAKRAEQCAAKINVAKAVEAASLAERKAREAARTAKAKAEEAEEAAKIAEATTEEQQSRTSSIPAMCYTYPTPGDEYDTRTMETMQIIWVKVASIKEPLRWPLQVFGIVAVRDILDHKCNIIFQRPRNNSQNISEEDPYLALTGPSRAVAVSMKPKFIEVSLKVKGRTKSDDKDFSELVLNFRSGCFLRGAYPSRLSTLEFKYDIIMHSVEATICIRVTGGSWPAGFRGVFSAFTTSAADLKVKLLDFGDDDGVPVDAGGMIKLSRSVVSVGLEEMLKVSAMACPMNKDQACESSEASFKPAKAGISPSGVELKVGSCNMEVSVAWSLFCRR
ncbi:unnamed protein product [Alopecurus aequalis]